MNLANNLPILLSNDGDVILFYKKGLLRVGDLKMDFTKRIKEDLICGILYYGLFSIRSSVLNSTFYLGFKQVSINILPEAGLECELLQVGGQKWVNGILRALVNIDFTPLDSVFVERLKKVGVEYGRFKTYEIENIFKELNLELEDILDVQFKLEFYSTQTNKNNVIEPSLDHIRQMNVE